MKIDNCPRFSWYLKVFCASHIIVPLLIILTISCKDDEPIRFTPLTKMFAVISSPYDSTSSTPGEAINFTGFLYAKDTSIDVSKLKARWVSDKDGLLNEQPLIDKKATFSTKSLSMNIHKITFEIRNEVDSVIKRSITVFNAIKLKATKENDYSITLRWKSITVNDFHSYKVYRGYDEYHILDNAPIAVITDFADSMFIDTKATLGENAYYKVYVDRKDAGDFGSNGVSIIPGESITVDYPILKIITDSKRDYAYGIVRPESVYDDNKTGYGLVFIDTKHLSIQKRILQDVRFADLDIDPDGNYLYLCARDHFIYKINLQTQELVSKIPILNSARKVEAGINNRVYYHVELAANNNYEFRIVDVASEVELPAKYSIIRDYYSGDFELDHDNTIFHCDALSSATMSRFSTTNDTFSSLIQQETFDEFNDLTYRNGLLFWGHTLFNRDLVAIGQFKGADGLEDFILDASADGGLAIGWGNLYDVTTLTPIMNIPANYDDAIFLDSKRLALVQVRSSIYEEYTSIIYKYTFDH